MARVTVEDCIVHVPNRFELLLLSAQRAKQIASGTPITVERDNDKDSVVALREIADLTIDLNEVMEGLIQSFCKKQPADLADKKLGQQLLSDRADEIKDTFEEAGHQMTEAEAGAVGLSFSDDNMDIED